MKSRLCRAALALSAALGLTSFSAYADSTPYRTLVDKVEPAIAGLTIAGTEGSCSLLVLNRTAADVLLFDLANHPVTIHPYKAPVTAPAPSGAPTPVPEPETVHLVGNWACSQLPAISEDQRWNEENVTLLQWVISGSVNQKAFAIRGRTVYFAADDPATVGYRMLRYGAVVLLVLGLIVAVPSLAVRRRAIFRKDEARREEEPRPSLSRWT